jgi:hypothetical protein
MEQDMVQRFRPHLCSLDENLEVFNDPGLSGKIFQAGRTYGIFILRIRRNGRFAYRI